LPGDKWAAVTMPVLVMDGGASPAYMHHGAEALTALLPHAQHRRFPGQGHGAADEVLGPPDPPLRVPLGEGGEMPEIQSSRRRRLAAPSHTTGRAGPHPAVRQAPRSCR
jgi:hypothetical protein